MAQNQRSYDHEYKVQAVKLALEIGSARASRELGISRNTIYGWVTSKPSMTAGWTSEKVPMTLKAPLHLIRR